ncbi:MAG: Uma2 family endonuclease [Myxococcota bacterium]|nr:Uma2 family endonuclease [Myxococcota bacterium]
MQNVAFSAVLPGQDQLPSEDGEPMETGFHDAQDALLKDTLLDAWPERRFFVAGNMFVYFSERQVRNNDFRGPDVFVVLDVDGHGRKSWVAWEEGGRLPDVVIEVTSESTVQVDRGEKMQIYAQIWRTPAYFLFDPETELLEGFALDSSRRAYTPLSADERGDLLVAPLGLKLGLRPTRYRNYDRRFVRWLELEGNPLPTAQERTEAERARADAAERRLAELERKLADKER